MKYVVAFYAVDRAYGGPEEGGWWFDTGELVRLHRVCLTEAAAARLAVRANRLLDLVQRGQGAFAARPRKDVLRGCGG